MEGNCRSLHGKPGQVGFAPTARRGRRDDKKGKAWAWAPSLLDVVFGAEEVDEQRHHEKDCDDGGQHASYDDAG